MKSILLIMSIMGTLFLSNAFASQDHNTDRLMERIQALEERLAEMESRFSFTFFMPDFAERFHVMHRAGEAGDWAVEHAIEDSNHEKFEKALVQTISSCNACHTATGSDFVQVTLDASDSLSMRHPHRFMEQQAPSDHAHGMSSGMSGMSGMMTTEPESDDHQDDADSSGHGHDADTPAHVD
jgi:hypothetical protein